MQTTYFLEIEPFIPGHYNFILLGESLLLYRFTACVGKFKICVMKGEGRHILVYHIYLP